MKKLTQLFAFALTCCLALQLTACANSAKDKPEAVNCAPCTVSDIYSWNEDVYQEFFYLRLSANHTSISAIRCIVNGEEWSHPKQVTEELTAGTYEIRFYTPENFKIEIRKTVDGKIINESYPYVKDLTLSVTVSTEYADVYNHEYRMENGLWVDPTTQDWYKECLKETKKTYGVDIK